jgi:hypothetical protein
VFAEYECHTPYGDQIASYGGPVDLLIGRDYAPYIQTLNVLQAPSDPDKHPSIAFTKLGCYLFGGIVGPPKPRFATMTKVNFISKFEDQQLRDSFHGDILGVKTTKLCTYSDTKISGTAFIKHVKATTTISDKDRVRLQMPWKPGIPEAPPNNYDRAFAQIENREKRLVRDGKLDEYNQEIDNLVDCGVVQILDSKAALAKEEKSSYLNHRTIERPDKSSTKLRVVFDSASPFQDGNPEDFNCISGTNLLYPYGQIFVVQTPDEERINPCNMLKIAKKHVTMFWDTWLRHISNQLFLLNKWFITRDNLKEGGFVINLQPGLKGGTLRRGLWN